MPNAGIQLLVDVAHESGERRPDDHPTPAATRGEGVRLYLCRCGDVHIETAVSRLTLSVGEMHAYLAGALHAARDWPATSVRPGRRRVAATALSLVRRSAGLARSPETDDGAGAQRRGTE